MNSELNMETNNRSVLFLKGFNYGIPTNILTDAFMKITDLVISQRITTIAWDGDLLTHIPENSTTENPVKSFTLLLPMIYSWALQNVYSLEFIFGKKAKSIDKLFWGAKCELDGHGTYLGPYNFLNTNNTLILEKDRTAVLNPEYNIGVAMNNDISWKELGITFMKWMKNAGVNEAYLLVIGKGDIVTKELIALEELGDAVPTLYTEIMEFTRDSVP